MTRSGLGLKRKRKPIKTESQGKLSNVKDIFTKEKKKNKNGVFNIGSTYLPQA
jgi:hypothetical protein